jgi:hypothetical protein
MVKTESIGLIQITNPSEVTDELKTIYEEAFPPDERRDWDQVLELLIKPEYQFISVIHQQKTIGLIIGWNFQCFKFIEHFVILNFLSKTSARVILEVDEANTETDQRRISFYESLGFSVFPGEYYQPAYSPTKKSIKMLILSYPNKITKEEFSQIRTDLYRFVYSVIG